jgi:L-asparaginase
MTDRIKIIATGGTFDKVYDPISGQLVFNESHIEAIVKQSRIQPQPNIETVMLIDSLDMTEEHRQRILAVVQIAAETKIVIIHGTDTMTETAKTLGQANLTKTIVLTGAMVPADIVNSDAQFNLGFALGCANTLATGTYVAMNANVHAWNNVRKNKDLGIFEKDNP